MIVTTKKLFEAAYGKYAIGAYNINNLEQAMGLFRGSVESKAPFIIQISKGALQRMRFFRMLFLPFTLIMAMMNPAMIVLTAVSTARS
jgi:fructose/tagatose bisphosphate aldolase